MSGKYTQMFNGVSNIICFPWQPVLWVEVGIFVHFEILFFAPKVKIKQPVDVSGLLNWTDGGLKSSKVAPNLSHSLHIHKHL